MPFLAPKFLFVPVSSSEGIGEYMRSLILADAVQARWPMAQIRFILNRHSPSANQCPYATDLLAQSPTKEVNAVKQIMDSYTPDVVIFDASGRQSQLQHAHRMGAKVIFLSQHKRKRSRGMRLSRARVTDHHWVVQPEYVLGDISAFERFKLKLIGKAEPSFIGPIYHQPHAELQTSVLEQHQLTAQQYIVINAGSGGHYSDDKLIADEFAEAAALIAKQQQMPCVMVFGPNYPNQLPQIEGVICVAQMNHNEFINLLSLAKVALLSGGDTMLQAIAMKVPTVAVAVSKDQPSRIDICVQQGLVQSAVADAGHMASTIKDMLQQESLSQLQSHLALQPDESGLQIVMHQFEQIVAELAH